MPIDASPQTLANVFERMKHALRIIRAHGIGIGEYHDESGKVPADVIEENRQDRISFLAGRNLCLTHATCRGKYELIVEIRPEMFVFGFDHDDDSHDAFLTWSKSMWSTPDPDGIKDPALRALYDDLVKPLLITSSTRQLENDAVAFEIMNGVATWFSKLSA